MKRFLIFISSITFFLSAHANGVEIGGIYYLLNNDDHTASVTYMGEEPNMENNYTGDIIIPDTIHYESQPYTITSIDSCAFFLCWNLTSISIPQTVKKIGNRAFVICTSLNSINLPDSLTSIGDFAFQSCNQLTTLHFPNKLESIGKSAFSHSGLTEAILNEGLLSIEEDAFGNCTDLIHLRIPSSVKYINHYAFHMCYNLESIIIDSNNNTYDSRENCNALIETATNYLIIGCQATVIPYSVKTIGSEAFQYCKGLKNINFPNSVQKIYDSAFSNSGLTSISIPKSVKFIGQWAFHNCEDLESVSIEENAELILETNVFQGCQSLPTYNNARYADTYLVEVIDKTLTSYQIKDGTKYIGADAFNGCENLGTIALPNSVKEICGRAFRYCTKLSSVTFPDSLEIINHEAFHGCTSLKGIILPHNLKTISFSSFRNCESLTEITIPQTTTKIGGYSFGNCTNLTSIDLPYAINEIEEYTFYSCENLKTIVIPPHVGTIGEAAFSGCSGLTTITCLNNTPPTIDSETFSGVSKDIPLYVPEEAVSAYQSAEYWKDFTHILPLLVEVKSVSPDTAQLTWMPVDSASMYRLHIYAESITFDTTLVINADNTNGGTISSEAPNRQKIKHIVLDDIGTIIVITIDPQSGTSVTQPFIVNVSTNTTNEIDFRFDMTVLSGNDTIRSEEGFFTLNEDLKTAIQSTNVRNTSDLQFGIYDLYGHRYSIDQYPALPAGVYLLRKDDGVVKVMKE